MDFNRVILAGRLTRDIQLRFTPSGRPVGDFGLAVNRYFTDSSGQKREETCFVDVVVWNKQAEVLQRNLRKGNPLFMEGRLQQDSWEGKDGQRRSKMRVVLERFQFLGGREGGPAGFSGADSSEEGQSGTPVENVPRNSGAPVQPASEPHEGADEEPDRQGGGGEGELPF